MRIPTEGRARGSYMQLASVLCKTSGFHFDISSSGQSLWAHCSLLNHGVVENDPIMNMNTQ